MSTPTQTPQQGKQLDQFDPNLEPTLDDKVYSSQNGSEKATTNRQIMQLAAANVSPLETSGKPSDDTGFDGQVAIDDSAGMIYRKAQGAWNDGNAIGGSGGGVALNATILGWAKSSSYQLTNQVNDANGTLATATVTWPDLTTGAYHTTTANTTFFTVDAFTLTYAPQGGTAKTVTQPLITRNSVGAEVLPRPAMTIA